MKNLVVSIFTNRLRAALCAGVFFLFSLTGAANADIQSSSDLLRACMDNQIIIELSKKTPSKKAVLSNCSKEFRALISLLPEGAEDTIKHDLYHGISEQFKLKKPKSKKP